MSDLNLQEIHKINRYEVFFDNTGLSQEEANALRLACFAVEQPSSRTVRFTFYDFEGSKEYKALNKLANSTSCKVAISCYDGAHNKYESITITGICSTEPVLDFRWSAGTTWRNLVLYMTEVEIVSVRA